MGHKIVTKKQVLGLSLLFSLVLLVSFFPAILLGAIPLDIPKVFTRLTSDYIIFWDIRMPRVLMAAVAGAVLGICGAVYQGIFSNPLAEPYILGVSGGAAFAAVIAIISGIGFLMVPVFALFGAGIAVALILRIAVRGRSIDTTRLILAGIILNTLCGALIMLAISLSPDKSVQNIVFWLMGDLSDVSYSDLVIAALAAGAGIIILYGQSLRLNIMALGDDHAISLGIDVNRVRFIVFISSSLMIAGIVSFVGLIGFVGLIVPHIVRLAFASDNRLLLPLSALGGAIFLVICDTLSRIVIAPSELPVGVITALLGAPLFLYLLKGKI